MPKIDQKQITPAAAWVLYFEKHPQDLPPNAPDYRKDAEAFAEWAMHNLPVLTMKNQTAVGMYYTPEQVTK